MSPAYTGKGQSSSIQNWYGQGMVSLLVISSSIGGVSGHHPLLPGASERCCERHQHVGDHNAGVSK